MSNTEKIAESSKGRFFSFPHNKGHKGKVKGGQDFFKLSVQIDYLTFCTLIRILTVVWTAFALTVNPRHLTQG